MSLLEAVRNSFLEEGRSSPNLLADVARLEHYVSETYSSRSLIELLQNSDDAGASRFSITLHGNRLFCSNDGRPFSQDDLVSLCRSGSSKKIRGTSIGYRGIGFKSVVSLAKQVHLISGPLSLTFGRELTAEALELRSDAVPLVRIPHPSQLTLDEETRAILASLLQKGMVTIFIFEGVDVSRTMGDAAGLSSNSLLFLRNVTSVIIELGSVNKSINCSRTNLTTTRKISLNSEDQIENWEVLSAREVEIAFSLVNGKRTPLKAEEAIVHAYLPTFETTGLGVRINADFSTDPSRTRILLDDSTLALIDRAADTIVDAFKLSFDNCPISKDTQACLAATFELATIEIQRPTFRTALATAIRNKGKDSFAHIALRPSWLNPLDFVTIASEAGRQHPAEPASEEIENALSSTLRFLGARILDDQSLTRGASSSNLTPIGRAEIAGYAIRSAEIGNASAASLLDVPGLWEADDGVTTIRTALSEKLPPTKEFEIRLQLAGIGAHRLPGAANLKSPSTALPTTPQVEDPFAPSDSTGVSPTISVTRWRHGENVVAEIFRQLGYLVEDHSRQNIGYDFLMQKDDKIRYVEVKSINRPGESFILTSNEEAFARKHPDSYFVALYRETREAVEICMIPDPANTLALDRQCRQWVWECSRYQYNAKTYNANS